MIKCVRVEPRWRVVAMVLLLLLLAIGGGWLWLPPRVNAERPPTQWLRVEPQRLENQLGLTGRIQAATRLTLSAPFEGTLKEVLVVEGQRVVAGQPLLTLDTSLLDIKLRQSLAELLKAQRTVQELQNWQQGQEVARARRTLNNARITLANTEASLKDIRTLFARGIVARTEVDALEQQAQAQRMDQAAALAELQFAQDKGRGEYRQITEMELANVQSRHQTLLAMQAQQIIRAPFDGVLVIPPVTDSSKWQSPQPGMHVAQGVALFGIINPERLQVVASIEEADLYQLREGMPVNVDGDGFPGLTLHGHIQAIGIEGHTAGSDETAAHYDVLIAIDVLAPEARPRLRLGMSAQVSVVTYRNEHGIAVPAEALHTDDAGNSYVIFRPDASRAPQRQNVIPGLAVPQGVEVSGLAAGEVAIGE